MTRRVTPYHNLSGEQETMTTKAQASDPLKPPLSLLVKVGSAIVHTEEFFSPGGHEFDKHALDTLLADAEVRQWIKDMKAFLPVKR